MTRNGKIARLLPHLRDELNRRLDNGEPGVRLVEWLNTLPEVKQSFETEFEDRHVSEVNLTDWKNGSFLDWQAQHGFIRQTCSRRNGRTANSGNHRTSKHWKTTSATPRARRLLQ